MNNVSAVFNTGEDIYEKINYIATFPSTNGQLPLNFIYEDAEAQNYQNYMDCALAFWRQFLTTSVPIDITVTAEPLGVNGPIAQAGCTSSNAQNICVSGIVTFNTEFDASFNPSVDDAYCNTAAHELGHILGILDAKFPVLNITNNTTLDQSYQGPLTTAAWQADGGIGLVYFSEDLPIRSPEDGVCGCDRHFSEDLTPNILMQPYSTPAINGLREMTEFQLQNAVDENGTFVVHNTQYLHPWRITPEAQTRFAGKEVPYELNFKFCIDRTQNTISIPLRHFIQYNANLLGANDDIYDFWFFQGGSVFTSGISAVNATSVLGIVVNGPLSEGQREQVKVYLGRLDQAGTVIESDIEVVINIIGVDCDNYTNRFPAYAPLTNITGLPNGLSIDSNGCLVGQATTSGTYLIQGNVGDIGSFSCPVEIVGENIAVCDNNSLQNVSLTISNGILQITNPNAFPVRVTTRDSTTITPIGGQAAASFLINGSSAQLFNQWNDDLCVYTQCP